MTSGSHPAALPEMTCAELSELGGLYVLDALDPAERDAVRAHLATCPEAHAEIRELGGVLPALASISEPVDSPPDLKARVMAAVAAEPRVADVAEPVSDSVVTPRQRPVFAERRLQPPQRAAWRPPVWASWGAAVAAVLVLAVVGVWALGIQSRAGEAARRDAILSEAIIAFSQPGSSVAVLQPSGIGTEWSGFAASTADGTAYLVMVNLPQAPSGKTYQAWFIRDSQPSSAGLMTVDRDGYAVLTNSTPLAGVQVVALTVEPLGGSEQPTSEPLASGEVRPV